jgi:glucose/arabinose dehydrogenase
MVAALVLAGMAGNASAGIQGQVFATGFDDPVLATSPPNDIERLFVVEQTSGLIRIIKNGTVLPTPFLNLTTLILTGNERGLLGLAFHPDYATNGFFYVNYTRAGDGATVVARYTVSANPDVGDAGSALVLFTLAQPAPNHNAGSLLFGPNDGFLYIPLGDGGGGGGANSQDLSTPLGKILRLDVDIAAPYVAAGNPYIGQAGVDERIWARGLRNPWRCSFDSETGDLYIGDVGQVTFEEIDYQPAASTGMEDYGWPTAEGFECTGGGGTCGTDASRTPPVHTYVRAVGRAVSGGYVYRGAQIPEIYGTYFFGDYSRSKVFSLRMVGGVATEITERTAELTPPGEKAIGNVSSFGEDGLGELYICDYGNGRILKIVTDQTDTDQDGLTDADEIDLHNTDPDDSDSDDDGFTDLLEVSFGSDPNNPASFPIGLSAGKVWLWVFVLVTLFGGALVVLNRRHRRASTDQS